MFIELTSNYTERDGTKKQQKFIMDFHSAWEIYDTGDAPAHWVNNKLGMNKNVAETYSQIKDKFRKSGLLLMES